MPLEGGGLTQAQILALVNTKIVIGTYTGDGTANREIDVGGEVKMGFIIGTAESATDRLWVIMKGAETLYSDPLISIKDGTSSAVASSAAYGVEPTANGFTLASAADYYNNTNTAVYYYVVFVEVT